MKKEKAIKILNLLKKNYPDAKIILNYSNNFELLVAVVLSAQTTDVVVNKVTTKLFKKYRIKSEIENVKSNIYISKFKSIDTETVEIINFAEVNVHELEEDIKSIGLYRNKAKNIKLAAKMLLEKFNGKIPRDMNDIQKLPGVGRKSANVILENAYGIVEGIAVDTHVLRLSQRLGFSKNMTAEKVEKDLMKLFPKIDWFKLTYLLIDHGRKICDAKKPKCDKCFLSKLCPSAFKFSHFKKSI
ncbi:MAG: endonuclease III [Patescibacteria group bacterium]|nr:endonuclease III [Patescibacteria group bacterium]